MPYKDPEKQKAYQKTWTKRNRPDTNLRKKKHRDKVALIKEASPCTDCGQYYPSYVMQYDHIADNKVSPVAKIYGSAWSTIMEEIAKCELVCANCHAIRTHNRLK